MKKGETVLSFSPFLIRTEKGSVRPIGGVASLLSLFPLFRKEKTRAGGDLFNPDGERE